MKHKKGVLTNKYGEIINPYDLNECGGFKHDIKLIGKNRLLKLLY